MNKDRKFIDVWCPLIRSFHWLLLAAFLTAWWADGRDIRIHIVAGTIVFGLLLFRIIWGVVGASDARFASFWPTAAALRQHLIGLLKLQSRFYRSHTPLGTIMIVMLLVSLLALTGSGMALMALQMGIGTFAGWAAQAPFATEMIIQTTHAWSFNTLQLLIAIHLAGVLAESLLQGSNLVSAMITGKKQLKE